ncbi:hypothetical protein N0V82_006785 [Gnomoniopsis sp. IMI 355080]|nr:hypothetical protein N0V82_006785 [Gnomoniopsis sp. IMI 355080]
MTTSEAEILVHITAPSTSNDDALYRTFATAYLNFEPYRTVELPEDIRSIHPAPPPEVLLSPQASFQSVWDNVRPRTARSHSQQNAQTPSQHGKASQTSWVQPPSEVADSMPDNDIRIEGFTTPTRLMSYFLQTAGTPSDGPSASQEAGWRDATTVYTGDDGLTTLLAKSTGSILQQNDNVSTAQVAEQQSALQASKVEGIPDVTKSLARGTNDTVQHGHPSTAPVMEMAASSFRQNDGVRYETPEKDKTTSESKMDETHISQTPSSPLQPRGTPPPPKRLSEEPRDRSGGHAWEYQQLQNEAPGIIIPATQLPGRADTEPPPSKRLKAVGRSISDILPRGPKESVAPLQTLPKDLTILRTQTTDWTHETQLTSVEPPPANHKLGPRVPVKLELLMRNFGIEGRYKPKFQARKLREYERGYWLLDLDAWDHQGKVETWGFLGNYICKDGFAGWGTRACRDEDWRWIRLYGWEHIAGELYILLYVASYRRLKAMELTWYDGAGKELIIVGARSEKSILDWSKSTDGF